MSNDVVCFWGQLWKGVLLAGICYLKIIAGVNKNAKKLGHFGILYEEVGRKKVFFQRTHRWTSFKKVLAGCWCIMNQ